MIWQPSVFCVEQTQVFSRWTLIACPNYKFSDCNVERERYQLVGLHFLSWLIKQSALQKRNPGLDFRSKDNDEAGRSAQMAAVDCSAVEEHCSNVWLVGTSIVHLLLLKSSLAYSVKPLVSHNCSISVQNCAKGKIPSNFLDSMSLETSVTIF